MKKNNQILYILIGVLLGVIVILGALFYHASNQIHSMELQVKTMKQTMKDTLIQVKTETPATVDEDGEVDDAYVDVNEADGTQEKENKKEKTTETPAPTETPATDKVDAATEFDDLQPQVETLLSSYQDSVSGDWAVYVEDLKSGGSMTVNNEKMQAASLIKLYIMGAVYEHYDELMGESNLTQWLTQMITVSDNDAANSLVKLLGNGDTGAGMMAVNAFCSQYNYGNTSMGRLLLEENPSGENYTSVADCGKFLYHVYTGKFTHADEMLDLLKGQTLKSKIPAGVPEGIETASKTGELEDVQNDVAIVFGETPYILCVMSQGVSGTEDPVSDIAQLSSAIYGYINQT